MSRLFLFVCSVQAAHMPNSIRPKVFEYKGFDDYIEVFRAGSQTSSDGVTQNFTHTDLDQIVSNHQPAPIVIGHPKADAPAYGWSHSLKRDGDVLLAKFSDVEPQFEKMVADKRFPNRSVKIKKTNAGWQLAHVGWLGAAAPAVAGLKPVQFSTDEQSIEIEFMSDAYATSVVSRTFRRLRDFLIENFGAEKADRVVSDFDLEMLGELAVEQRLENENPATPITNTNSFKKHTGDKPVPKTYTDEEIATLEQRARDAVTAQFNAQNTELTNQLTAERSQRLTAEHQAFVTSLIDEGKLTPAQVAGMVEFMLAQPTAAFEFTTGEGETKSITKKPALDWFREFTARLPKQMDLSESNAGKQTDATGQLEFHTPQGAVVSADRLALHNKAREYMNKNNCDYVEAVIACEHN